MLIIISKTLEEENSKRLFYCINAFDAFKIIEKNLHGSKRQNVADAYYQLHHTTYGSLRWFLDKVQANAVQL